MVLAFRHIAQGLVFLSPGDQRPEIQHALLQPVQIGNRLAGRRDRLGKAGTKAAPRAKNPQQKGGQQWGGGSSREAELE